MTTALKPVTATACLQHLPQVTHVHSLGKCLNPQFSALINHTFFLAFLSDCAILHLAVVTSEFNTHNRYISSIIDQP
jgi:hypothetical protein